MSFIVSSAGRRTKTQGRCITKKYTRMLPYSWKIDKQEKEKYKK
jgi:hypothetical protein